MNLALNLIRNMDNDFDGAIIDLNLVGNGKENSSGNDVIRKIIDTLRFPIFIVTGTPQNVSSDLDIDKSIFFEVISRDEFDFNVFSKKIINIYNTGIVNILNNKGEISKYLNDIFWNHISSTLDSWINDDTRDLQEKQKSIIRYVLLHMNEYISNEIEKYHPSEFYIYPPVKKSVTTGDIILFKEEYFIVLTPLCDFVIYKGKQKAKKILLCKIKNLGGEVKNFEKLVASTEVTDPNRERLNNFISNNANQNFHFVPRNTKLDSGLIDFQDTITINKDEVDNLIRGNEIQRIATVSGIFLKDIISRYSSYFARQGSPDFNSDEIYKSIFN